MSHGLHPGTCKVCHSFNVVHEGVQLVKGCTTSEKLTGRVSDATHAGSMHDTYVRYTIIHGFISVPSNLCEKAYLSE